MVVRARANAEVARNVGGPRPSFLIGDVASLAFPDGSFDVAVSTLSMHHWSDQAAGLVEIGRVLRAGGRALIWDFRPGVRPHPFASPHAAQVREPWELVRGTALRVESVTP